MKTVTFLLAAFLMMTMEVAFGQQAKVSRNQKKNYRKIIKCEHVGIQKVRNKKYDVERKVYTVDRITADTTSKLILASNTEKVDFEEQLEKVEEQKITEMPLPQPVYFRFDSDELTHDDIAQIVLAVEHARMGRTVILEGHTDDLGSHHYNFHLSKKRAEKIKEMMVAYGGVNPDLIIVVTHGEHKPAKANDTEENRKMNRRVEFVISQ